MQVGDYIQFGMLILTILGFVVTIVSLKKDNRKSNQETIEKTISQAISEVSKRAQLEMRVSLLEQKVHMNDSATQRQLDEIKQMLAEHIRKSEYIRED